MGREAGMVRSDYSLGRRHAGTSLTVRVMEAPPAAGPLEGDMLITSAVKGRRKDEFELTPR